MGLKQNTGYAGGHDQLIRTISAHPGPLREKWRVRSQLIPRKGHAANSCPRRTPLVPVAGQGLAHDDLVGHFPTARSGCTITECWHSFTLPVEICAGATPPPVCGGEPVRQAAKGGVRTQGRMAFR